MHLGHAVQRVWVAVQEQHSGEDLSNNTSDEKDDEDYESASDFEHVSNLEDDFQDDYQDSGDEERCNAEAARGLLSHRGMSSGLKHHIRSVAWDVMSSYVKKLTG